MPANQDFDNTNRGALFKNDRRTKDTQPTHTGTLNVEGVEYWLSAWVKEARSSGQKYFSVAITKKTDKVNSDVTPMIWQA